MHGIVPWPLDAGAEIVHGETSDVAALLQHSLNMQLTEREYPNYVYWHDKGVIEYAGEQAAVTHPVVKRTYGLLDEVCTPHTSSRLTACPRHPQCLVRPAMFGVCWLLRAACISRWPGTCAHMCESRQGAATAAG